MEQVTLYRAPTTAADCEGIADWLRERIDATITVRDRFLGSFADEQLPEQLADSRVLSAHNRETGNTMTGIVRYEERAIEQPEREGGVVYDGLAVQRLLGERIPPEKRGLDQLHVILLDRALATWGDHDGRWHKRVNVLGQPALVSVPGLYEAPAKPESYYRAKQKHALMSGDTPPREVLEEQIEGEFLVEDDPRTTTALCGYVLQAIHYLDTGEAFCDDDQCRLANPHRQPGVVAAQLQDPELCDAHAARYGPDTT